MQDRQEGKGSATDRENLKDIRRQEIRQETQTGRKDREAGQTEMKIEILDVTVIEEKQIRQAGKTGQEGQESGQLEDT